MAEIRKIQIDGTDYDVRDTSKVPTTRTINNKQLNANITLDANDIPYDDDPEAETVVGSVGSALFQRPQYNQVVRVDGEQSLADAQKATGRDNIDAASVGEVSDLKSALPNTYVALAGENQVTPQNIAGVEFTKTETPVYGDNIFSESYLGETDYYTSINTNVTPPIITHSTVTGYRWYAIPVDGESTYQFTGARFACLGKGNTIGSEAVGTLLANTTEIDTTGASYLFLTYTSSTTSIEVRRVGIAYEYSNFIMPTWMRKGLEDAKPKYISTTGSLSDGTFLALMGYKQNLRKGERYVFSGNITTMSVIKFGFIYANAFSASTEILNEFTIDGTYITYKNDSTSSSYINRYEHGITFSNNLQFIFEYLPEGNAKITLISSGMMFSQTLPFVKQSISQVVVLSVGSTLTNCKLTWTPIDIDKTIWMFGDSYFAYSSARWTYYMQQYGYAENVLLDGWPGEGSVNARNSLMTLIQFGTPKYIVWCMGMNDGSDTDANTPSSNWTIRRDEMLAICNENGITPIFATIPNVPSILHTGKNAWIKASGYRYIDFAAAVGAESAGSTWYSGMLSSDNIHPSESGAKALFARALVDFPELMLNE